jgi:hypothetical protein
MTTKRPLWPAAMLVTAIFLATGPAAFAEKPNALLSNPPGKPRAPVLIRWSEARGESQLAADLVPLADYDEIVVRLVIPGTAGPYREKRFAGGKRGQKISVAWHELSQGGVPRISVTMIVRGQTMNRSIAYPVRSSKSMAKLNIEMKRAHGAGRIEEKARVLVLPAAEEMQP